tara:strand:- start:4732 stop:5841 length:1110 start_codon:yes stop_codon:yes gene_type:complete
MKELRVIISGGGTGGHIFPAIAIAKSLEKKVKKIDILFVGAKDRMEMRKIPELGYDIKGLWISGLQRKLSFNNLLFPFKLIVSIYKSIKIINNFNPDLVIGTGGYASGPVLFVSSFFKCIPTLIQEQNSFAGLTNKLLSKYVNKICVAYDGMDRFFPKKNIEYTGNPIRDLIINSTSLDKQDSRRFFGLNNNRKTILVLGGSLGSKTINESIINNIDKFNENDLNLIWQTGSSFELENYKLLDRSIIKDISIHKFIREMDKAYSASDIVVSRAGAIAISEISFLGKASILVPSPNVAEDHQTKNAQSLVEKKSALMVKDKDSRLNLVDEIIKLSNNITLQKQLSLNVKKISRVDAADRISSISLKILKK